MNKTTFSQIQFKKAIILLFLVLGILFGMKTERNMLLLLPLCFKPMMDLFR